MPQPLTPPPMIARSKIRSKDASPAFARSLWRFCFRFGLDHKQKRKQAEGTGPPEADGRNGDQGRRNGIGAASEVDSAAPSSMSPDGFGIASITSMPRVWQIFANAAGSAASVTKVWIWLIWAMRTGALRLSFVESATSMTLRALAMMACDACTSR